MRQLRVPLAGWTRIRLVIDEGVVLRLVPNSSNEGKRPSIIDEFTYRCCEKPLSRTKIYPSVLSKCTVTLHIYKCYIILHYNYTLPFGTCAAPFSFFSCGASSCSPQI